MGLSTFGDVTIGPDGEALSHAQVLRNVVAEAERLTASASTPSASASTRVDFAVSAPEVVLAAIAGRSGSASARP
ncbi:MAG: hypothetical protein U0470_01355 [Anaerolineae bacterium]